MGELYDPELVKKTLELVSHRRKRPRSEFSKRLSQAGITQEQAAQIAHTDKHTITGISTGKYHIGNLSLSGAADLAKSLGISLDELYSLNAQVPFDYHSINL